MAAAGRQSISFWAAPQPGGFRRGTSRAVQPLFSPIPGNGPGARTTPAVAPAAKADSSRQAPCRPAEPRQETIRCATRVQRGELLRLVAPAIPA